MIGSTADTMGASRRAASSAAAASATSTATRSTTYENGVRRVHVASHHELEQRLSDAGLGADAIAADVAALHDGRVLVLVTAA